MWLEDDLVSSTHIERARALLSSTAYMGEIQPGNDLLFWMERDGMNAPWVLSVEGDECCLRDGR